MFLKRRVVIHRDVRDLLQNPVCSVIHIKGFLKSSKQHPYVLLTLPTPLYLLDHTAHKTENLRPVAEPFLILDPAF